MSDNNSPSTGGPGAGSPSAGLPSNGSSSTHAPAEQPQVDSERQAKESSAKKNPHKRHTARYRARRRAADILYEAESRDIDPVAIVEDRMALSRDESNGVAPIAQYTQDIVRGAAEELDLIDETIARYLSDDWEFHRLPAVDRAILRVGAWELLFNPEIPKATAVVEGVELASQYSTDKAAPYIHAVLDDIAQANSEDNPMVQNFLDPYADEIDPDADGADSDAVDAPDAEEFSSFDLDAEAPEANSPAPEGN